MKSRRRDNGEGSVYQEGEGRWRAALLVDGKMVRWRATSEKEAKAKLKEMKALRDEGISLEDRRQTVATWCEFWLTTILPAKQVKARTLETHRYMIEHYVVPYLGHHQLLKLKAHHIDAWQATLRQQGLSTGTITNARRRLRTALEMARKRSLVPENVVSLTEAPKEPARRKEAGVTVFTEDQVRTLLTLLEQEQHRLYALYVLACTTGMRQAELMGLRWGAIDLALATLVVREQLQRVGGKAHRERTTKGGKERTILLSTAQVAVLKAHQVHQAEERKIVGEAWAGEDLVFTSEDGTPLTSSGLGRQFRRAVARAKLPRVTFHSLRHSAGSIMLANGAQLVAVSHVLGHASPAITAKIYAHAFESDRRHAVEVAARALLEKHF